MKSRFLVLIVIAFLGCGKGELPVMSSLRSVQSDPEFARLPLIGTTWKLVGFADEQLDDFRTPEPNYSSNYLVNFRNDGQIDGRTAMNTAKGTYRMEQLRAGGLTILNFDPMTYGPEPGDSPKFCQDMRNVSRYAVGEHGLRLYHANTKFMLFQPFNP